MPGPTPKQLDVWMHGAHVGTLLQIDGRLGFVYAPGWMAPGAGGVPLSQSLPLRAEPFDDRATRPFFAGLLPEEDKRRVVAQVLHVSRQNDFGLLDALGGECAGAVTLLEPGQQPASPGTTGPDTVRWLGEAALGRLLADLPRRPLLAGEEGLRLSLAGAQDKLPVVVDLSADPPRVGLPLFGTPSTHILKPAIPAVDGSVFNEAFCMTLARALKLVAAPVQILRVAGQPTDQAVLLVGRYDRRPGADALHPVRLHQEDFCQALSVVPEHKYQNEGGPDLAQCFELLRRATRPSAPHLLRLLDAVVFNALIGNHDAHGKNFSLLYDGLNSPGHAASTSTSPPAGLAPLYDALSTAVYPELTAKMAMKLGSKYKFTEVMARHWEQFARDAGLSPAQVRRRILAIASQLPALATRVHTDFQARGDDHPILAAIVTLIAQRCALTTRRLTTSPD